MKVAAYQKYTLCCEALDMNIYFEYKNSVIFSTKNEHVCHDGMNSKLCSEVVVISKCETDSYNSVFETSRLCRGELLVIQGIISFFTGFPLTVYSNIESNSSRLPIEYKKRDVHLSIDDIDYTSELLVLLLKIEEEPKLIITLLDRWRKAIYLKQESQDADLYYDEAVLSFFHILELFGDSVSKELKDKLDTEIEKFLSDYFELFYFTKAQNNQKVNESKKILSSILVGDHLTLGMKVKYFLDKYNMYDDSISFFIDSVIKVRNAVAHGRISYQDKFLWPLPPFFSLAKDSYEQIDILFFLTARMISKYVNINCWAEEWNETKASILPRKEVIDAFLHDTETIITKEMLLSSEGQNITWHTIFSHYVKNPKKDFLICIENKLKDCFIETNVNEVVGAELFNLSIIFADSEDAEIRKVAIQNVKTIIKNHWYGWSNFKDAYIYLEFYNVPIIWYKTFLENSEYSNC